MFGQALTNLNGSGVNARQAPGQMVALSKYLIKPVLTNFNIGKFFCLFERIKEKPLII